MLQSVLQFQRSEISKSSFSDVEYGAKQEIFLAEMNSVGIWDSMIELIEPVYPKSSVVRLAYALSSVIRVFCMQKCSQ